MNAITDTNKPQDRNTNLDALRGIFALAVVFSHIALIRYYFGLSDDFLIPVISQLGKIGVTGFFVLSGFLITINLLKEKETDKPVGKKMGSFYLKRILRIWPLYYAVILASIFVFPHIDLLRFTLPPNIQDARALPGSHIYYYALLPQVPLAKSIVLPFAEPTWSIGVEEIFYLIIPVLFLFKKVKKDILIYIAIGFILLKYVLFYTIVDDPMAYPTTLFTLNMLNLCRFECILVGCFAGCMFFEGHKYLEKIGMVHFIAACVLLLLFTATIEYTTYQYYHFAAVFAIIILYAAKNPHTFLNNRVFAFIGKISFSLYMTHELAIVFWHNNAFFMEQAEITPFPWLYIVIPATAILLAFVAYNLIERPFLIIKNRLK